jgi:hypothetical protein
MKQPRTKLVDRITTGFIHQPYPRAAMAVMCGLLASLYLRPHHNDVAYLVLGYCFLFMAGFNIYFLARAVDTLRVEDTVPQPDELVGMHLDQK